MTTTTCPCCGSAVRVHVADEGTCSYEPAVSAATIETARAVVAAWERLGRCEDEFTEQPEACGEHEDALDDAIISLRAALPPKADGPTSEPRIRTIGDLTRAMTEAGLEPPGPDRIGDPDWRDQHSRLPCSRYVHDNTEDGVAYCRCGWAEAAHFPPKADG